MSTIRQLRERWLSGRGAKIHREIQDFLEDESRILPDIDALLAELPFRDEISNGRDLRGIHLNGAALGADLQEFNFSYARLEINFFDCDLRTSNFQRVVGLSHASGVLTGSDFRRARLPGCSFESSILRDCYFDGAILRGAHLEATDLTGSSFRGAQCLRANFVGSTLHGCDFREAVLDQSAFMAVRLDASTDLRGASLVDLFCEEQRDIHDNLVHAATDWRVATWDETTITGTHPVALELELLSELRRFVMTDQRQERRDRLVDFVERSSSRLVTHGDTTVVRDELANLSAADRDWVEDLLWRAARNLL
jgi:uncharacterized protein YjbI with pentapeptide repeats